MTKDEIFNYVMDSPENTNPAVLRSMLNNVGGGSGGGLPPYENADINKVLTLADSGETGTETLVAIEEQTVTTVMRFGTAELTIDYTYWTPGVTVHLTVDGNNYDCIIDDTFHIQAIVDGVTVKVWKGSGAANFLGQPSTTYTVSATIEAPVPIPAPAWVTSGGGGGVLVVNVTESRVEGNTVYTCDKTAGEMAAALDSGGIIIRRTEEQDGVTGYLYYPVSAATVAPDFFYSFTVANPISTLQAASASEYPATGGKQPTPTSYSK